MTANQTDKTALKVIYSIHDIMPETFGNVQKQIQLFREANITNVGLLIVPNKDWSEEHFEEFRNWHNEGFQLVGHGWNHEVFGKKDFYHKLHSLLLSRNVAEHLSKSTDEVIDLIRSCYNWFEDNKLPIPKLYVPPAWAFGKVTTKHFDHLPFQMYENVIGVYDRNSQSYHTFPLIGFEADTRFRMLCLYFSNSFNKTLQSIIKKPLRVSLHPNDLEYYLGYQIHRILKQQTIPLSYEQAVQKTAFEDSKVLKQED